MEKLNYKVAVITGANSGIGLAILKKLVEAGMKVIGFDIVTDNIEKIAGENPEKVFHQKVDVCDYEALKKAFRYVEDVCGGLDVLINNAGILRYGNILDNGDENIDGVLKTIDTNFAGVVRCCRLGFDSMKSKDFGYIINMNSVDGHYVPRNFTSNTYCGTKYAVTALTEVLRQELISLQNSKIRVTSLSPGAVDTELFKDCSESMQKTLKEQPSLKPEDIADTVYHLLETPTSINITELTVRPTAHPY